jgi:hypothetical protein
MSIGLKTAGGAAAVLGGLAAYLGMLTLPLLAHHSFQAEFDAGNPVNLTGVVTKLEWTNPHVHFYLDVADAAGKVTGWNLELASPNVLRRLGWNRNSFKVGDSITVLGARAKDGANMANARTVTLADGRKMSAGSSADEPPDGK